MDLLMFLLVTQAFVEALPNILELSAQKRKLAARNILSKRKRDHIIPLKYISLDKISERLAFIERLAQDNNRECFKNLRMSKVAFNELCKLLKKECGLKDDYYVSVVEKVAIFLRALAHHQKNRVLQTDFQRSGQTISQVFHQVLRAVLKLGSKLLATPVPVDETTTDKRFKWFKGCLGALDETYIPLHVLQQDAPRYRTRKGHLATNVLGVCDTAGRFIYMLVGWESSDADSRVLRDALTRPNGLRVSNGSYYLCDSGFMNGPGFLTSYRQTRYHLQEWASANRRPQNSKELFILRHSAARNVIERAFGVLKKRFSVIRHTIFYPVKTQCHIILACSLLHNFVINVSPLDLLSDPGAPNIECSPTEGDEPLIDVGEDTIQFVNPSPIWTEFCETLANDMWEVYSQQRLC